MATERHSLTGCMFCRQPVLYRQVCITCRSGFERWVVSHSNITKAPVIHKLLCKHGDKVFSVQSTRRLINEWPGFYTGNNTWLKPSDIHFYCEQPEDVAHLNAQLKANNIHIHDDIQIPNVPI